MNETKKTGVFWGVAAVVALIATIVAWPTAERDGEGENGLIGGVLFEKFKDPLVAASMKIVTFDDSQGTLENFEVRKDKETGTWTIPSKSGYPADAVEQMRDAANALVGLKVLDSPTNNAEDHSGMGVVEPKLEDLDVGDEGVGQLVTFKDESQTVLGSLIIGDEVKGQPGQRYVRIPGQDPVYAVALDPKPLTTSFQEWIEEDLLQLSSIDIEDVEVKDYNASLGLQGVSLSRNYTASLSKDGSEWELASLKEFDKKNPLAEPKEVLVTPDQKLNAQKLNEIGNALDDLKFVDVLRKPEGISADLKADKDFAANQEASQQLARRGFIPVPLGPNREIEILSANGELTATTKDGVQYILRFGNISGISDEDGSSDDGDADEKSSGGVNRYLMVSTIVDDAKFPAPDLKPIPQTLEDLEALDKPPVPPGTVLPPELNRNAEEAVKEAAAEKQDDSGEEDSGETEMKEEPAKEESGEQEAKKEDAETDSDDSKSEEPAAEETADEVSDEADSKEMAENEAETKGDDAAADETSSESAETADEPAVESGETDAAGEGESTTVGEAQDEAKEGDQPQPASDSEGDTSEATDAESAEADSAGAKEESADESDDASKEEAEEMKSASESSDDASSDEVAETEEEKLERLAAMQEKITKENERKLDDRKEKLEAAKRLSQKLNARFADWYYVIPEDTYSKLRISRDDLFDTSDGPAGGAPGMPPSMPGGMPNFGGGFPGN